MSAELENLIKKNFLARNFCTSFDVSFESFDVTVKGFGVLPKLLQPRHAKALIGLAEPSVFGFKDQTLFDPDVRNSYEIKPDKIILGDGFKEQIDQSLQTIKKDLLLSDESCLRADLHNMLVYEKGCFFDFHQDSEKAEGMVASLVIILPTNFTGGDLVINYQGLTETVGDRFYNKISREYLKFVAFYADCQHKIEKIKYGYRIALTFNLIVENPVEAQLNDFDSGLCGSVKKYFSEYTRYHGALKDDQPLLAFLLNHQYTQKSLSWKQLKGEDKETAAAFKQTAKELDLDIYLTLADIQETWSAYDELEDDFYRRRPWNRFYDRCRSPEDNENLKVEELLCSKMSLSHWLNENSEPENFGSFTPSDRMVFSPVDNNSFKPYQSEYEGFVGNAGNTLDRWYKRSAIVMWPKKYGLSRIFAISPDFGIEKILERLSSNYDDGLEAYLSIRASLFDRHVEKLSGSLFTRLLVALSEKKYLEEALQKCPLELWLKSGPHELSRLLLVYGDESVFKMFSKNGRRINDGFISDDLYIEMIKNLNPEYPLVAGFFLSSWMNRIRNMIRIDGDYIDSLKRIKYQVEKIQKNLLMLFEVLEATGQQEQILPLTGDLYEKRRFMGACFLLDALMVGKLSRYLADRPVMLKLKAEARKDATEYLEKAGNESDFTIDERPRCTCELCDVLAEFLNSGSQRQLVWPIKKEFRRHVHQIIDELELPVTHTTRRQGSPHQLILSKSPELKSWRKKRVLRYKKFLDL